MLTPYIVTLREPRRPFKASVREMTIRIEAEDDVDAWGRAGDKAAALLKTSGLRWAIAEVRRA